MTIDRMFAAVDDLGQVSSADAILGEPLTVEGKTIIPVAAVSRGFGIGFDLYSSETEDRPEQEPAAKDGGVGGVASSRPIATIEVTEDNIVVRPIADETKVTLAAIALIGWVVFWIGATVRSVFGKGE